MLEHEEILGAGQEILAHFMSFVGCGLDFREQVGSVLRLVDEQMRGTGPDESDRIVLCACPIVPGLQIEIVVIGERMTEQCGFAALSWAHDRYHGEPCRYLAGACRKCAWNHR